MNTDSVRNIRNIGEVGLKAENLGETKKEVPAS